MPDSQWTAWAQGVLQVLQAPRSQTNLSTLAAWSQAESGPPEQWMRWNNPLNTTQPAPGARDMNSVGVKAYPDVATGVRATATTLTNGRYPTIVAHLRSDVPAAQWADACGELGTWGTGCAWVGSGTLPEQEQPPQRSLYGQGVVGEMLTSPWFPGSWQVTQGWGPTDYGGEPEGHGYQHWHAGVDIGVDCGTVLSLPMGINGTARALDNPGGYGTALIVLVDGSNVGILLGHLRQRLVDDGQALMGGHQLAVSNSTGNSTGCHVHFEVRPQDPKQPTGLGKYGTDLDPSQWLTAGQAGSTAELFSASPTAGLSAAFQAVTTGLISGAQVLLGALLVAGGLVVAAYGIRGQSAGDLQRDARRTYRRLQEPRVRPRPRRAPEPVSTAAESRVRPDLQRRRPAPATRRPAGASEARRRAMLQRVRVRQAQRPAAAPTPAPPPAPPPRAPVTRLQARQRARQSRRR